MIPISCVMPTTIARRWCIPLAIDCFQRQTYPAKELLIVFDGPGSIEDLIPDTSEIKLVELSGKRSLGEKFNVCIELATHDLVALWADDDWHAPYRLEKTIARLSEVQIVGTHQMLFHDLQKKKTWLYTWSGPQHFLLGGTLAFHRSIWERAPFPDVESAVDNGFIYNALIKNANPYGVIPDSEMYVAMAHGDNTRGELVPNWPFRSWDRDIHEVMGNEYDTYLHAFEEEHEDRISRTA